MSAIQVYTVQQAADNAHEFDPGGFGFVTVDNPLLGQQSSSWMELIGVRFQNINLSSSDTVIQARVRFTVGAPAGANLVGTWGVQAHDDAPIFTNSSANLSSRSFVSGNPQQVLTDAGGEGFHMFSVNLADQLQDVIERGGWSSGNSVCIFFHQGNTNNRTIIAALSNSSYDPPELHIATDTTTEPFGGEIFISDDYRYHIFKHGDDVSSDQGLYLPDAVSGVEELIQAGGAGGGCQTGGGGGAGGLIHDEDEFIDAGTYIAEVGKKGRGGTGGPGHPRIGDDGENSSFRGRTAIGGGGGGGSPNTPPGASGGSGGGSSRTSTAGGSGVSGQGHAGGAGHAGSGGANSAGGGGGGYSAVGQNGFWSTFTRKSGDGGAGFDASDWLGIPDFIAGGGGAGGWNNGSVTQGFATHGGGDGAYVEGSRGDDAEPQTGAGGGGGAAGSGQGGHGANGFVAIRIPISQAAEGEFAAASFAIDDVDWTGARDSLGAFDAEFGLDVEWTGTRDSLGGFDAEVDATVPWVGTRLSFGGFEDIDFAFDDVAWEATRDSLASFEAAFSIDVPWIGTRESSATFADAEIDFTAGWTGSAQTFTIFQAPLKVIVPWEGERESSGTFSSEIDFNVPWFGTRESRASFEPAVFAVTVPWVGRKVTKGDFQPDPYTLDVAWTAYRLSRGEIWPGFSVGVTWVGHKNLVPGTFPAPFAIQDVPWLTLADLIELPDVPTRLVVGRWHRWFPSGTYNQPGGPLGAVDVSQPATGRIRFIPSTYVVDVPTSAIIVANPIEAILDLDGRIEVQVPVTDHVDHDPSGWHWIVQEVLDGGRIRQYDLSVPTSEDPLILWQVFD